MRSMSNQADHSVRVAAYRDRARDDRSERRPQCSRGRWCKPLRLHKPAQSSFSVVIYCWFREDLHHLMDVYMLHLMARTGAIIRGDVGPNGARLPADWLAG